MEARESYGIEFWQRWMNMAAEMEAARAKRDTARDPTMVHILQVCLLMRKRL